MEALFESQERTIDEMDTLARQLETEQKTSVEPLRFATHNLPFPSNPTFRLNFDQLIDREPA